MRLAAINTTASPFHAPASLMLDVVRGFVDASGDNRAMVLYGRGIHQSIPGVVFHKTGNQLSVINHYLWSRTLDRQGLMSRRATAQMIEYLKEFRPDIIHLHNLHGHYLHYPSLLTALERLAAPVVITLHDKWLMTGRCCFSDKCVKWQQSCSHCPNKSYYPPTLLSHSKINHLLKSDCINRLPDVTLVAPSQWAFRHSRESLLRLCPAVTIPNGVRQDVFKPLADKSANKSVGTTTILAIANKWEARKRPDIIRGIAELLTDNEHLLIVGDTDGLLSRLNNTTYIPSVADYGTLVDIYHRSDWTLSASTNETYGMTIAESMSCGTPVIVPSDSAMAEYVSPSDGYVIDRPTPEVFINAIRNAVSNRNRLSPKSPYSRSEAVKKYLDLFAALTND